MTMQFEGTLDRVLDAITFKTGSRQREFWATELLPPYKENEEPVKNKLSFSIFSSAHAKSDFTACLDEIPIGSKIKFTCSARGNEWKERVYVNLRVTSKIEVVTNDSSSNSNPNSSATPPPATPPPNLGADDNEEMPF